MAFPKVEMSLLIYVTDKLISWAAMERKNEILFDKCNFGDSKELFKYK